MIKYLLIALLPILSNKAAVPSNNILNLCSSTNLETNSSVNLSNPVEQKYYDMLNLKNLY